MMTALFVFCLKVKLVISALFIFYLIITLMISAISILSLNVTLAISALFFPFDCYFSDKRALFCV